MKRSPLLLLPLVLFGPAASADAAEQLKGQTSFFAREHVADAIDWMPWGEAAFARAKKEQKPLYVFVGATTSELCRAMQKQSFVNPQIITALNRDFVCVLIDRDEREDLAALFQSYLQASKQLSGWPANVWLTPDLKPFDGATYLPPSEEWGKEGILNVVRRITEEWKASSDSVRQKAAEAASTAAAAEYFELGPPFSADAVSAQLDKARTSWLEHYDSAHPGFGEAPRFAEPELLRFLLKTPGPGREAALSALGAIDRGALHDPLDGGFFHRTIDAAWEFPSFQKFLADQARLALAFLDAAKVSGDAAWNLPARGALDYALSHLANSQGACIHAEDASAEEITLGYGWTLAEINAALGEKDAAQFVAAYGIKAEGNVSSENDAGGKWKGRNLLLRKNAVADAKSEERLTQSRAKLLALRQARAKRLRDENVLIGENGLLLLALSRAGVTLHEPRYLEAAAKLADFLQREGIRDKGASILRLAGSPAQGGADDFAYVALGLSEAGTALKKPAWIETARALLNAQQAALLDPKTGRFFASATASTDAWMRPHLLDPAAGEPPSAESSTLLAYVSLGEKLSEIPQPLLRSLTASLNDPNGPARGDVLLTASELVSAK